MKKRLMIVVAACACVCAALAETVFWKDASPVTLDATKTFELRIDKIGRASCRERV